MNINFDLTKGAIKWLRARLLQSETFVEDDGTLDAYATHQISAYLKEDISLACLILCNLLLQAENDYLLIDSLNNNIFSSFVQSKDEKENEIPLHLRRATRQAVTLVRTAEDFFPLLRPGPTFVNDSYTKALEAFNEAVRYETDDLVKRTESIINTLDKFVASAI